MRLPGGSSSRMQAHDVGDWARRGKMRDQRMGVKGEKGGRIMSSV
jgi:hypothetical protein